jgi:hypothetical protein
VWQIVSSPPNVYTLKVGEAKEAKDHLPGLTMYLKQGKTIFGDVNLVEEILLM